MIIKHSLWEIIKYTIFFASSYLEVDFWVGCSDSRSIRVVSSSSVLIALVAVLTRLFQSIEWLSGKGRAEEGFLAGEVGLVNLRKE